MRLCRFEKDNRAYLGIYQDDTILPLDSLAKRVQSAHLSEHLRHHPDAMEYFLPPDGVGFALLRDLLQAGHIAEQNELTEADAIAAASVKLLPPVGRPPKLLLLAGNYVEHILEQGDLAAERANTFPYVFMKPPTMTLVGSGASFSIPAISPHKIDYELELGVIIGRGGKNISTAEALTHVAGYTVINDISDRGFKPNPTRQERPRDKFFDWQHGKWHDGSCPCGPCFITADEVPDPQNLWMKLSIDGRIRQDASTALQVFTVAEVINFISSFMTLERGDIISTGTPAGVGNATGEYLRAGQRIEASIEKIGTLVTPITSI